MGKKTRFAAAVCLVLAAVIGLGIWFFKFHSYRRGAFRWEEETYSACLPDWMREHDRTGLTTKAFVQSLCALDPDNSDGEVHYTSDGLEAYLYRCETAPEVYLLDEVLYVEYVSTDGWQVSLHFRDGQTAELYVYDREKDILYQEDGTDTGVVANYYRSLRRRVQ